MNRAHQPRAVGFAGFCIDDDEVDDRSYNYTPRAPKEETIERCEAAWKILVDNKTNGITKLDLNKQMKQKNYVIWNCFEVVLENYGYLIWMDGTKIHPFRHPDGTFVELEPGLFD